MTKVLAGLFVTYITSDIVFKTLKFTRKKNKRKVSTENVQRKSSEHYAFETKASKTRKVIKIVFTGGPYLFFVHNV